MKNQLYNRMVKLGKVAMRLLVAIGVVALIYFVVHNIDGFAADISSSVSLYDNSKVYSPGSIVLFNNNMYEMVEGAGAPGYAPLRPGDQLWKELYDNNKIYKVGDVIRFKGASYTMVEGAGAPGYAPNRPGDKLWGQAYSNNVIYRPGDRVAFKGAVYRMVEGAGAAGYAPDRQGDRLWTRA